MVTRRSFLKYSLTSACTVATGIGFVRGSKQNEIKQLTRDITAVNQHICTDGLLNVYVAKPCQGLTTFLNSKVKELEHKNKHVLHIKPVTNMVSMYNEILRIVDSCKYDAVVFDDFAMLSCKGLCTDHHISIVNKQQYLLKQLRIRNIESHIGLSLNLHYNTDIKMIDQQYMPVPSILAYSADNIYRIDSTGIVETMKSRYTYEST